MSFQILPLGLFSTPRARDYDVAEMYKYNIVLANSDEDDEIREVSVVNTPFLTGGWHYFHGVRIGIVPAQSFQCSRTPVAWAGTVVESASER